MIARTLLLLAPIASLGCGINNDCGQFNPFGCAKDNGNSMFSGGSSAEETAEPPTSSESTDTTEDTSVDPPTSMTDEPTTMPPPDPVCDMDSVCDPGEDMLDDCPDCETCGNGMIDGEEQCDDGNSSNQDACVSCNDARCGDGYRQIGVEDCDDGDGNSDEYTGTAHCNATCTDVVAYCGDDDCQMEFEDINSCPEDGCKGMCGNNIVEEGETCDEGGATQTCDADCTDVMCGDGQLNEAAGELCDDGNEDNTDACLPGCMPAKCGDGVVQADVEECDDNSGKCDPENCSLFRRKVFVTKETRMGYMGGLGGADTTCQSDADAVMPKLGGNYEAWLSTNTESPITRFNSEDYKGLYVLVDGTVIADGWEGLLKGSLEHAINLDQEGNEVPPGGVWTNTTPAGIKISDVDCNSWGIDLGAEGNAATGSSSASNAEWSQSGTPQICTNKKRLYCFEVP